MEKANEIDKIIGTLEFTPEQSETISAAAGRKIRRANIVELSATEVKRLAPGLLYATVVKTCW